MFFLNGWISSKDITLYFTANLQVSQFYQLNGLCQVFLERPIPSLV